MCASVAATNGLLIIALAALLYSVAATPPPPQGSDWRACVLKLDYYFGTPSPTTSTWRPDATRECGYESLADALLVDSGVLDNRSVTFIGDSTAIRMFVYTVNRLLPADQRMPYGKVADAPLRIVRRVEAKRSDGTAFSVVVRFFRMMFVSTAESVFTDALGTLPPGGQRGLVFVTVGNWDMNWKIQLNQPMPGLDGPVHNWAVAQRYWTKYVDRMFATIATVMEQIRPEQRPAIVFREQYLPNCAAPRFSSKKRKYRMCRPLIRPVVVPYYRRTLLRVAWAMDIPVIHGFIADRPSCAVSDGLHLDYQCMAFEQELIWNVGRMLLGIGRIARGVPPQQGSRGAEARTRGVPTSDVGANESAYRDWYKSFATAYGVQQQGISAALATVSPAAEPDPDGPTASIAQWGVSAKPRGVPVGPGDDIGDPVTESGTTATVPPSTAPINTSVGGVPRTRAAKTTVGWGNLAVQLLVAVMALGVLALPLYLVFK